MHFINQFLKIDLYELTIFTSGLQSISMIENHRKKLRSSVTSSDSREMCAYEIWILFLNRPCLFCFMYKRWDSLYLFFLHLKCFIWKGLINVFLICKFIVKLIYHLYYFHFPFPCKSHSFLNVAGKDLLNCISTFVKTKTLVVLWMKLIFSL